MAVEVAMGTISRPADNALREHDRQRELPYMHLPLWALAAPHLKNAATAGFGPSRSCSLRCSDATNCNLQALRVRLMPCHKTITPASRRVCFRPSRRAHRIVLIARRKLALQRTLCGWRSWRQAGAFRISGLACCLPSAELQ